MQMQAQKYFAPDKMLESGIYYYPEAWNPAQWDRDFKKMAEMGFEFTHFAEFAWAQLEPKEGKFDFTWLDKAVELASKNNLKVVMCTPSPTPPVWLVRKYPQVLVEMANGQKGQHGTRQHASWSSPIYRKKVSKIVTEMAKHYGNDKRIWGWQIDNEPSHYGTYDYSPAAQANFKVWLKNKYKTIENLNAAWGTSFWSGVYTDFKQIEIPNQTRLYSATASPISVVDFRRFSADENASFVLMQYNILRNYLLESQFVTTNYMHNHPETDPWRTKKLDVHSYTVYPVAGYSDGVGEQGFRLGDPWRISFSNDYFRSINGLAGVMELQPGQVNWGSYNPLLYPGLVRAWLWNAFGGGLKFVCSYRFRQPLSGGEQFHYGMVGTDGVTELSGGLEYRQFMKELKDIRKQYNPQAKMPAYYAARKTAMMYNLDNYWETDVQKQTYQWNEYSHLTKYYSALKGLSIPVDFIDENADFSAYSTIVAPAYQMLDAELVNKWTTYVKNGGHLILSCRTGLKDRNGHFVEGPWAASILNLIGAKIKAYDLLSDKTKGTVLFNSNSYVWNNWGDIIEPNAGTETWATYGNQFYKGQAAVIYARLGKGSVTYLGVDSEDGKFEKDVLKKSYETSGIPVAELPEGVMLDWRDGFWVAVNYSSTNVTIDIPAPAQIILGTKEITPAGVVIWKE